ncbi:M48 family metalloprotease [Streptomyces sp. NPDC059165]|uniref:M48 family metalloprotease n=1 Tax=Streptomyces sp. NPDC059165 TaxID=3346751 RepID=UPI0036BD1253
MSPEVAYGYGQQPGVSPEVAYGYGQQPGVPPQVAPGNPGYGQQYPGVNPPPPSFTPQQPAASVQQPPAYGQQPTVPPQQPAFAPQPGFVPQQHPGQQSPPLPPQPDLLGSGVPPAPLSQPPTYPPVAEQVPGAPTAPGRHAAPRQVGRKADTTAVTTLLLMVPSFLGSLLVVWLLSELMPTGIGTVFILAWLASGALVFYRPAERLYAKSVLKWREPTGAELAALRPLWDRVTHSAGIPAGTYDLWIEDSEDLNAFAAAGHMVGVTRWALANLPKEKLTAVLAHELGHHLGGHAWAGLLGLWYALPGRGAVVIAKTVLRIVGVVAQVLPLLGCLVGLVFVAFVAAVALSFPPILVALVTPYLLAWAGRASELRADRMAAQLGYGPALHAVFSEWQAAGADSDHAKGKLVHRLMASHPPVHQRIRELERFAATGA